jgi:hypothetical protein
VNRKDTTSHTHEWHFIKEDFIYKPMEDGKGINLSSPDHELRFGCICGLIKVVDAKEETHEKDTNTI